MSVRLAVLLCVVGGCGADKKVLTMDSDAARPPDAPAGEVAGKLDAFTPAAPPAAPPAPWVFGDVGQVGVKGVSQMNTASYFVRGAGADIFGRADAFQFAHQVVKGNGQIIAKLKNVDYTHSEAKAGIMIRASLDPDAANVFVAVMGNGAGQIQARRDRGVDTVFNTAEALNIKLGIWLRLARVGRTITAYRSGDRASWTQVAVYDLPGLGDDAYFGLAATSHDIAKQGSAEFDAVRIDNLPQSVAFRDWLAEDVGAMGSRVIVNETSLAITPMGEPWAVRSDSFNIVYRPIVGDFTLSARVAALDKSHDLARVGLMARKATVTTWARNQALVYVGVHPEMGARVVSRSADNVDTVSTPLDATLKAPVYLRLQRAGTNFVSSSSSDGTTWNEIATTTIMGLPENLVGGIVASSNVRTITTNAVIDNVRLTQPVRDAGAIQ